MSGKILEPFGHIRRMQDERFPQEIAVLLPGDYFVSNQKEIIYTVLGSCISVCLRDSFLKIGGMNHFMLPEPQCEGGYDSWGESGRYGSFAMELLINELLKQGGKKNRFEVKVFGGGRIYNGNNDVGARNTEWILDYLGKENLRPVKTDLGDLYPRKIYFFSDSGRVLLKRIKRLKNQTIFEREQNYKETLRRQKQGEDVTLF